MVKKGWQDPDQGPEAPVPRRVSSTGKDALGGDKHPPLPSHCACAYVAVSAHVRRLRSPGSESRDPRFRSHREFCL